MVSILSISFMIISALIALCIVLGTFIYFRKKEKISIKPVIVGIVTFLFFTQVLEKSLHMVVMKNNLFTTAISFTIYGALAAGIFEEVGRFIMFKVFLKNNRKWKDGIAFGIGHGGIEAIFIGVISTINSIAMAALINAGTFEKTLGSKLPPESIAQLKATLTGPSHVFLAAGFERTFAFIIQIALTMIVLYAIRSRKIIYLFAAIILHALIDVPAALYQTKIITNLWALEGFLLIYAVISLLYIIKSKKIFRDANLL